MIHPILKNRRSPVMFSPQALKDNDLISIFEAARWAPSSRNQQPWRYIVATKKNKNDFENLYNCLTEGNKLWAKNVPVLCLCIAELISDYNFKENFYARHDVGLSAANLIFQAMSLGIYVHIMGGFDAEMAKKILKIPERFEAVTMIGLGYPAESNEGFVSELIEREEKQRSRKEISEILFYGKWGGILPLDNK